MHAKKITTSDVANDLKQAAAEWQLPLDQIDFDILSCQTFYHGTIDEDWRLLEAPRLEEITTEVEIRSVTFSLRQECQILIREIRPNPHFDLCFTIASDKHKSKVIAIIDPASTIPLKKGVQEWIKDAIHRKMLRTGLFIGVFDANLPQEINKLLLKLQKEGPLKEPYRLLAAEGFSPIMPINDAAIPHYKKIKRENNLVNGVQPDDLILEYIFPKNGRDGRNCRGEFVPAPKPVVKYANAIRIDENTIRAEQDEKGLRFYATLSGFVERKGGIFTISQELQLESASFKQTGSIEAGTDKDIHIKIKHKEHGEDAVGSGINIDVQKLDVSGTVGSHAKIQACEITIGAQTHKKSQINVTENATIHLHRGNLKAKEATIEILEAGRIEADTVRVARMMGGEIIARQVYIDTLYSNAKITALELIEVQNIQGDGNNLIIDPDSIESYHEKIAELETKIHSIASRLQEEGKEYFAKQLSFKDKNSRIKYFQQKIINAKKTGSDPEKADLIRLQQYRAEAEKLKEFGEKLQEEEKMLHALQMEQDHLYDADLHAKVTHYGTFNGHTRIVFVDPKTKKRHATTPDRKIIHITLRKEGDEKRFVFES